MGNRFTDFISVIYEIISSVIKIFNRVGGSYFYRKISLLFTLLFDCDNKFVDSIKVGCKYRVGLVVSLVVGVVFVIFIEIYRLGRVVLAGIVLVGVVLVGVVFIIIIEIYRLGRVGWLY